MGGCCLRSRVSRDLRVRDMAERLDLSERGVALILRDRREAGYVTSRSEGRRIFYSVVPDSQCVRIYCVTSPWGSCLASSPTRITRDARRTETAPGGGYPPT